MQRIHQLLEEKVDFAFETTLSTRSYVHLIKKAQKAGYAVHLLFFWLSSPVFAKERVARRVLRGGHNIPADVIERRYYRGLSNLVNLYIPICNSWMVIDNMDLVPEIVVQEVNSKKLVRNADIWNVILMQSKL